MSTCNISNCSNENSSIYTLGDNGGYQLETIKIEFLVMMIIFCCIIVLANIFCLIILGTGLDKEAQTYLMISLSVADLCVGLATLFPRIWAGQQSYLDQRLCDTMAFLNLVSWVVSIYALMWLSVDRACAIVKPLYYHTIVTDRRCFIAIVFTWTIGCFLATMPLLGIGAYKYNYDEVACYLDVRAHPIQWLVYNIVIFVPTSTVIISCNAAIWKVSARQRRQIAALTSPHILVDITRNYKSLRTLLIILGAFYVAWTPFVIEHLAKAFSTVDPVPESVEVASYVIAISNSFWNPIIYVGTNRRFRQHAVKMVTRCFPRARFPVSSGMGRATDEREMAPTQDALPEAGGQGDLNQIDG